MGLGAACKEETSRMKNVSIKGFGRKKIWIKENCIHRKIPLNLADDMLHILTCILSVFQNFSTQWPVSAIYMWYLVFNTTNTNTNLNTKRH
jgi:hypothetical protein